ncbi:MAG: thioredoxin family protein [Pontiellaceae bacterium]|jgi:thiol-disulfide isomerase/thioredoxin|nr:thioredoxin family protein [Pontiellaceae bacterium]
MRAAITTMRGPGFIFALTGSLFLWGCGPEKTPVEVPPVQEIRLSNGQTVKEVIAMLGEPTGRAQGQTSLYFFYEGGGLEFKNGVLFGLTPELNQKVCAGEIKRQARAKLKPVPWHQRWRTLLNNREKACHGDPVHQSLLTPDKVTVVYFYASWCEGCTLYTPLIEKLVRDHEEVVLRRVNVGSQESSAVWTRYDLDKVPSVRVFDKKGRMVGNTVDNPADVKTNLKLASFPFRWLDPLGNVRATGEKTSQFFSETIPQ